MRLVAAVITAAFLVSAAPSQAASVSQLERKIRKLEAKVERVNDQRADWKRWATGLGGVVTRLQAEKARLEGDVTRLEGEVGTLQTDNQRLRDGLPNAILAVPSDQFWRLVFTPARQAWRCDSLYAETGYWSVSFDSSC